MAINKVEYVTWGQIMLGMVSVSLAFIYVVYLGRRRKLGLPPGPTPLPVIGNLHQLGLRPYEAYMKLSKKYGPIFSVDYGSYPAVILNNHELIRKVLSDGVTAGRPKVDALATRTGGKIRGIIFSELRRWMEQRRFLVKSLGEFGFGKKTMESQIMEAAQVLITKIRARDGAPIRTECAFSGAVLSSFWKIISGETLDEENPEIATLLHSINQSFQSSLATALLLFFPTLTKIAPRLTGYQAALTNSGIPIWRFLTSKIAGKKEMYKDGQEPQHLFDAYFEKINETRDSTSSFYGEEGDKQMVASITDIFIAGMETTSNTMAWVFLILALHPEIQRKVHKEITVNIKSRLPTLADRANMPFTECFIMEVNRFAAVVPIAIFHVTTEDTEVAGYRIPKGTWVTPNLYGVMHDPEIWGDPETIRPERFFTSQGEVDRHHPAYMPFSTGKRVCIGEVLAKDEIFLFITSFCQVFWVKPNPNEPPPTLDYHPGFTLSPKPHSLIFEIREEKEPSP